MFLKVRFGSKMVIKAPTRTVELRPPSRTKIPFLTVSKLLKRNHVAVKYGKWKKGNAALQYS